MKRNKSRKLTLPRQTLRRLDAALDLERVQGGNKGADASRPCTDEFSCGHYCKGG